MSLRAGGRIAFVPTRNATNDWCRNVNSQSLEGVIDWDGCPGRRNGRRYRGRRDGVHVTMIDLDTNVLIHDFAHDDPVRSERADMAIEGLSESSGPGYLTMTVLTRIHWVLRHSYHQDAELVAEVMLAPSKPDVISPSP